MLSPLVFLADSAPLFRVGEDGRSWLAGLREDPKRAAYLGASNGDQPEFYEIFLAAMDKLEVKERRHVKADATAEDAEYLKTADIVLLAGGDVETGLAAFAKSGLDRAITDAYLRRALLIGVSAGAVQLGVVADPPPEVPDAVLASNGKVLPAPPSTSQLTPGEDSNEDPNKDSRGFRFAPFQIDVHDEPGWRALHMRVGARKIGARGVGIPSGGGALLHVDGSLEPVWGSLTELVRSSMGIAESVLVGK